MAKSHIIPKSLYGDALNDPLGPAKLVTSDEGVHPKRAPKGAYDSTILCIKCEGRFSAWDDYACELFMQSEPESILDPKGVAQAGVYPEIDLHLLQMFFVSLLWRMQVTDHAMFAAVVTGPYEAKLKEAVLKNDPSLIPELDVVISRFDSELAVAFLGPTTMCIDGVNGYRVCFAHHQCWVKLDKRKFPVAFQQLALSNGEPLHVLFREFEGSPEKRALVDTVQRKMK